MLYVVLSAFSIILGIIIMFDITIYVSSLHKMIWISFVFSGASDLISTVFLSRKMSKYISAAEESETTAKKPKE